MTICNKFDLLILLFNIVGMRSKSECRNLSKFIEQKKGGYRNV